MVTNVKLGFKVQMQIQIKFNNRDVLLLNMTLDLDLVVLHIIPSMFGKSAVHAWM